MGAIEAVQAPEELGFEPIDRPPDVDQILAERVGRELIDGLATSPSTASSRRSPHPGSRTLPLTDYTKHLFAHATDNLGPRRVIATSGKNTRPRDAAGASGRSVR